MVRYDGKVQDENWKLWCSTQKVLVQVESIQEGEKRERADADKGRDDQDAGPPVERMGVQPARVIAGVRRENARPTHTPTASDKDNQNKYCSRSRVATRKRKPLANPRSLEKVKRPRRENSRCIPVEECGKHVNSTANKSVNKQLTLLEQQSIRMATGNSSEAGAGTNPFGGCPGSPPVSPPQWGGEATPQGDRSPTPMAHLRHLREGQGSLRAPNGAGAPFGRPARTALAGLRSDS